MQTTQGSLVIVGANTPDARVYWNGQEVINAGFSVQNTCGIVRVMLRVAEDPILAEMQAAGITIKRVTL
jgi:hypothetical protein